MRMLVIDGNSIVNRAFYGIRPLTTKDGQFTNAIYGFLTMLTKIKNEENPDAVAIAFDLKAPTFRHKAYAGYKATRKGMPEELASQILEKCKAEGMDSADLKIYVKPEDKKAYYACAGGNSYIEL